MCSGRERPVGRGRSLYQGSGDRRNPERVGGIVRSSAWLSTGLNRRTKGGKLEIAFNKAEMSQPETFWI